MCDSGLVQAAGFLNAGLRPRLTAHFHRLQGHAGALLADAGGHIVGHLVESDAILGHGVTLTDGHSVVLEGVEVHGDATRANTQYVVTEYGVVNLKGLAAWQRAEGLINISHPDLRDELIAEADKLKMWRRSNKR